MIVHALDEHKRSVKCVGILIRRQTAPFVNVPLDTILICFRSYRAGSTYCVRRSRRVTTVNRVTVLDQNELRIHVRRVSIRIRRLTEACVNVTVNGILIQMLQTANRVTVLAQYALARPARRVSIPVYQ